MTTYVIILSNGGVFCMDFDTILNNFIAGLACTSVIALVSFIFNFLRTKYKKDKSLFFIKFHFCLGLFGLLSSLYSCIINTCVPRWLMLIVFAINFFGTFMYFNDAIKYNANRTK